MQSDEKDFWSTFPQIFTPAALLTSIYYASGSLYEKRVELSMIDSTFTKRVLPLLKLQYDYINKQKTWEYAASTAMKSAEGRTATKYAFPDKYNPGANTGA